MSMPRAKKRPAKSTCKTNDNIKNVEDSSLKSLTLIDVTCPICLSIMIKPVSMPCTHSLCLSCFELNVSEANFACPLCRKRISIWVRHKTKSNGFINEKLWEKIQENFADDVKARINGDDLNNTFTSTLPPRKVCTPGEIKEEFETLLSKLKDEEELKKRKEEEASEYAIKALHEEEVKRMTKLNQEREKISNEDFQFAKKLRSTQINETLSCLKTSHKPSKSPSCPKTPLAKPSTGPLDHYLDCVTPSTSRNISPFNQSTPKVTEENNFIKEATNRVSNPVTFQRQYSEEILYPSMTVSSPLGYSYPSSPLSMVSSPSTRLFKDITTLHSSGSEAEFDSEENIINAEKKLKKEKSFHGFKQCLNFQSSTWPEEEKKLLGEHIESNDLCSGISSSSQTESQDDDPILILSTVLDENEPIDKEAFQKLVDEQKALEERLRQEKEDRVYAQQLQRKMKEIDRSKGSEDEYCLRRPSKKATHSSPKAAISNSNAITSPSTFSTPPSSSRNSKLRQTTLLESMSKRQRRL